MLLILQIAGGIVLAIFFLKLFAAVGQSYADRKEWKERQKAFSHRVARAEMAGWRWDEDSVVPYEEQLERWEADQTFERRVTRAHEAGWRWDPNSFGSPDGQLEQWERERTEQR